MAFFFAGRLGLPVAEVGGFGAVTGMLGIVSLAGGALGRGLLADKCDRRKPFALGGALLFAVGAMVMMVPHDRPQLVAFSSVQSGTRRPHRS